MATTRVKESCLPCRRRKTRCDDSQPCSSCVLRKTEAECRPGSLGQTTAGHRSGHAPASDYPGPGGGSGGAGRRGPEVFVPPPSLPPYGNGSRTASPSPRVASGPSAAVAAVNGHHVSAKKRRTSGPSPRGQHLVHGAHSAPGVSTAQTHMALAEISRLRASVNALEGQIVGIQTGLRSAHARHGDYHAGDEEVGSDSDARSPNPERERWDKVWAALPDLHSCEILLEYMVQECDFLYSYGDMIDVWLAAVRTRSLSVTQAGRLCIAFAIAALLLGQGAHPYYRPDCDPVALNVELWELAQMYSTTDPRSLDEVEVLVDMTKYLVFSGRHMPMLMHMPMAAMKGGVRIGLFDEGHSSWDALNEMQRERRRQIAADMLANCRWSCLVVKEDPLKYIKVNICEPTFYNIPLDSPIRSIPPDDAYLQSIYGDAPEPDFRLFRLKSSAERKRARLFTLLITEISRILPRVKALHTQMQQPDPTPQSVEAMAHIANGLYEELLYWLNTRLPENGLPTPQVEDVETTDIVRCKRAAQSLIVHHAVTYILSCVLRPWLTAGDRGLAPDSVQKRLHDACLTNADRVMQHIPVVKALLATRTQPVITPWSASNLFSAAMCYAVPLLRSVQKWLGSHQGGATEEDIRKLATWAGSHEPVGAYPDANKSEDLEAKPIPQFIYGDEVVRTCANHILKVLDVLSILRVSPLGATAEEKLRQLIQKYGLDSPGHSPEQLMAGASSYGLPQMGAMLASGGRQQQQPPQQLQLLGGFGSVSGAGGSQPGPSSFPDYGSGNNNWGGHIWGGPDLMAVSGALTRNAADNSGSRATYAGRRVPPAAASGLMQLANAVGGETSSSPTYPPAQHQHQHSQQHHGNGSSGSGTFLAPVPQDFIQQGRQQTESPPSAAGAVSGSGANPSTAPSAMNGGVGLPVQQQQQEQASSFVGLPAEQPDWTDWFGFEPGLSQSQVGGDQAMLEQLLSLDSNVWQGLLDPPHP